MGSKVKRWKVGDEVVIHCNQDDGDDEECNGGDPMFSPSQRIWGYETPDGSFAQFCRVQDRQLLARPKHLTWEESASYMLVLATAYRMLFGHRPHVIRPGHNVLVWGSSGGLGSMAVQLIATTGANAIGVVSEDEKRDFVMQLGARGVINRTKFNCWGELPKVGSPEYDAWFKEVRKFVLQNIADGVAQFVALDGERVVGWCDVLPKPRPAMGHSGVLGMGVIDSHRGHGIGRALMKTTLQAARERGLTRIELSVRADNDRARRLHENLGFAVEGLCRNHVLVQGKYADSYLMALLRG